MVKRWCRWFRGGADVLEVVQMVYRWCIDGLEVVQMVKRWCRWFRGGADG